MDDGIEARPPVQPSPGLHNADLTPVLPGERTWGEHDMASLWIGLVVSVSSWFLAGGLVEMGMSWVQGIATVFLANVLVLVPMGMIGHAGVKYGVPFPVLARSSFGVRGAVLPAVLRGAVAAGWYGLNTWLGGAAIHQLLQTITGGSLGGSGTIAALGITVAQAWCFLGFNALQVGILLKGMEGIRLLEQYSAPILIGLTLALLAWAVGAAGGWGPLLARPSQFTSAAQFGAAFVPALSAQIGYWATLAINIPDFSRYARSQRAQVVGQAVGLPVFMALFCFAGLAVTSATAVLFGQTISDPIALLAKVEGVWGIAAALVGLTLATLTTNLAANIIAPVNALIALSPRTFTFARAALLTSAAGVLIMPWRLISSTSSFYAWLVGYSVFLGPVAGILLSDYHVVRRRQLDIDALYSAKRGAVYWFTGGWNPAALVALAAGAAPTFPGLLNSLFGWPVPQLCVHLYSASWLVGFTVSAVVYAVLMRRQAAGAAAGAAA